MIRRVAHALNARRARLLALLLGVCVTSGCVSVRISNGAAAAIFLVPIYLDDDRGRMNSGSTYSDPRWFSDPDSHPAVRPKPVAKTPPPAGS